MTKRKKDEPCLKIEDFDTVYVTEFPYFDAKLNTFFVNDSVSYKGTYKLLIYRNNDEENHD